MTNSNTQKDIFKNLIQTIKANDTDEVLTSTSLLNESATANINLTGDSAADVSELMQLFKNAGLDQSGPVDRPMPRPEDETPCGASPEVAPMISAVKDMEDEHEPEGDYADAAPGELSNDANGIHHADDEADQAEEDYANEPDEDYKDNEYMQHDLSGGINGKKKMFKKAADGDNPMAVEGIKKALYAALTAKLGETKSKKPEWLTDKDDNKDDKKDDDKKDDDEKDDDDEKTDESATDKKFSGYSKGDNRNGHPDNGKLVGESKQVNDIVKLALTETSYDKSTASTSSNKSQHAIDIRKLAGI